MKWIELVIYVHGVTPEPDVSSHEAVYQTFHNDLNKQLTVLKKDTLGKPIFIEWGWSGANGKSKSLAQAEKKVCEQTFAHIKNTKDLTINPLRFFENDVRKLFMFGAADMFYYVSEDGKRSIRRAVFEKILGEISGMPKNCGISLTCIGHSAGSVILHDLLFNIFSKKYQRTTPPAFEYINKNLLIHARALAMEGKLRVKRLYTFGCPVTPLLFRSNDILSLIEKKNERFLDADDIGIKKDSKWINFWDKDDILAYPVSFLYESDGKIKDVYVDISDSPIKAHGKYWQNKKIITLIANEE